MSRDIKIVQFPSENETLKESANKVMDDMRDTLVEEKITGWFGITLLANGNYRCFRSQGISKHQQLGILLEMQHDLLSE